MVRKLLVAVAMVRKLLIAVAMVRKLLIAVVLIIALVIGVVYFGERPIPPLSRTIEYPASDSSQHASLCITACRAAPKDKIFPVFISVTNEDEAPLMVRSDHVFAATTTQTKSLPMLTIPPQEAARMAAAGASGLVYALTTISAFGTVFGGLLGVIVGVLLYSLPFRIQKNEVTKESHRNITQNAEEIAALAAVLGVLATIGGFTYSAARIYWLEESDEAGQANQEFTFLALKEEATLHKGFTENGYVYFLDYAKKGIKSVEVLLVTDGTAKASRVASATKVKQDGLPVYTFQIDGRQIYKCRVDNVRDCSTQPDAGRCLSSDKP